MPYKKVSELPPSTKNLTLRQKREFMRVFNGMIADGMKEDLAFPLAMKQAKRKNIKEIKKASADGLERDSAGNIIYSGKKFPSYNFV